MLKTGITGGIGSGKSIVCKIFFQFGIPVYDADDAAKKIMNSDEELIARLKNEFGKHIYDDENTLNRKELAKLVFSDSEALSKLNSMVHPAVGKDFEKWLAINSGAAYILKEAAILFESGANNGLDYFITVTAPVEIRIKRVMKRDNVTEEHVKAIVNTQMREEERILKSDFVIANDNEQLVIPQVMDLHNRLLSLSQNKK